MGDMGELPTIVKSSYEQSTITDAVHAPALQSLIPAVVVTFIALIWSIFLTIWQGWPWYVIPLAPLTIGPLFFLFLWFNLRSYWTWIVETVLTADLNGDGVVGKPERATPEIRIALERNNGQNVDYGYLPYPEKLPELVEGVIGNKIKFTFSNWAGKGKLYSQPEWKKFVDALIHYGYAKWDKPERHQDGVSLTHDGITVLTRIYEGTRRSRGTEIIDVQRDGFTTFASTIEPASPPPDWNWPKYTDRSINKRQ